MITLKPRAGLKIRDCVTKELIPDTGIKVEDVGGRPKSPYWGRLLRDRDVEIVSAVGAPAKVSVIAAPAAQDK